MCGTHATLILSPARQFSTTSRLLQPLVLLTATSPSTSSHQQYYRQQPSVLVQYSEVQVQLPVVLHSMHGWTHHAKACSIDAHLQSSVQLLQLEMLR